MRRKGSPAATRCISSTPVASIISVTARPGRYVSIPAAGLLGRGDVFEATRDTV